MSLILQTTGCIIDAREVPPTAQEDTSSLPSATSNVNNIEGKWSSEYTPQEDNVTVTIKPTVEYFPGGKFNLDGELSISKKYQEKNYTVNYSFSGAGTWSIDNDSLIQTYNKVKPLVQSVTVDKKTGSIEDLPPEVRNEILTTESETLEGRTEKYKIISLSQNKMKLELSESNGISSSITYSRV